MACEFLRDRHVSWLIKIELPPIPVQSKNPLKNRSRTEAVPAGAVDRGRSNQIRSPGAAQDKALPGLAD